MIQALNEGLESCAMNSQTTNRRAATRYDKLAANYLAFVQLASIRLWLRVNESTP